jgi:predicted ATPase/DNA-binding winged helix-turn-helix (wHTH) protein
LARPQSPLKVLKRALQSQIVAGLPEVPVTIEFGRFKVVRHRRELLVDGRPVELGGRAFDTLVALIDARGTVLTKDEFMSRVWPDRVVEENNLPAQIFTLRRVLGPDRDLIRTVAGRGYQFTGEVRTTAATAAALPPSPVISLPYAVSDFIGREVELREVAALAAEHRLVSLVGAGGIGKTRLSLEVARHLLPRFPDGVFVAELGPVSSPELVAATVASALGLTHNAGAVSPEGVAGAVGTRRLLVVIDNCEHVIGAAAGMAEALLRASPGAVLLATSREPLRVPGEYIYQVPPLEAPAEDNQDMEDVFSHGAVRLFVSRAHAAEPRYVAEARVAAATAAICRHLDGIPLAIELAATRIVAFGVDGVATRLDDRFRLLTGGSRTLPRHQTMRATLDWSYELLSGPEQVVLRRLAVFAGVFTLDAATAVAAGVDIPGADVVDAVANLVGKSLLSTDVGGAIVRYRFLETTRAYAREKLIESVEFDHVARRHAEYYRDLFQRAEADFETRPTAEWLAAYRPHLDDVRLALDWAFSPSGDAGVAVALTAAAIPLWAHVSLVTDCRGRVEQAIASLGRQVPPDPRRDMQLYLALGYAYLHTLGGGQEMNAALTKALELAEIMNDTRCRLGAIYGLYVYCHTTGDYRGALTLGEQFVAAGIADRSDVAIGGRLIAFALHVLGDQPGARRHLEPLVGLRFSTARTSHINPLYQFDQRVSIDCAYARVLWVQGLSDQATRLTERVVDYARSTDHVLSFLYTLIFAACPIVLSVGDLTTAGHHVRLAIDLAARHALGIWKAWAQCYEGILLIKRGDQRAGSDLLQSALGRLPAPIFDHLMSLFLAELAVGLGGSGLIAEGLAMVDKALARAEQTGARWYLAELLRTKGELLLLGPVPTAVETAEACFQQALEVARRQGALSWELRAAASLARLWRERQQVSQARKLLAPVYRRFTEGFGTADLVAAKALLGSAR